MKAVNLLFDSVYWREVEGEDIWIPRYPPKNLLAHIRMVKTTEKYRYKLTGSY